MKFSVAEINRLRKKSYENIEDQIKINILNFIYTIHLNEQDFIEESYDSKFFGDLEIAFKKKSGQVMGLVTATFDGEVKRYVFNDQGYELLDDLI